MNYNRDVGHKRGQSVDGVKSVDIQLMLQAFQKDNFSCKSKC
jgi:hypothetical protein